MKTLIATLAIVAMTAVSAQAAVTPQVETTSFSFPLSGPSAGQIVPLDKANVPAGYTLASVAIELSGTASGDITTTNDVDAQNDVTATIFTSIEAEVNSSTFVTLTISDNTAASDTLFNLGDSTDFGGTISASDSDSNTEVDPPTDLSFFVGPGTFDVDLTGFGTFGATGVERMRL